jgi:predicted transcriptional regulator
VLEAISDEASLELFKLIAITNGTSKAIRSNIKITRKQYYSRLSKLLQSGLIKRKNSRYCLTTFGMIIYQVHKKIENELAELEACHHAFDDASEIGIRGRNFI